MRYLAAGSLILLLAAMLHVAPLNAQCIGVVRQSDSTGMYTMQYAIAGNKFSGILILKKETDSAYRAIIMSEMGLKILDMQLTPDGYKLNHAIKQLRKKIILRSFYTDLWAVAGYETRRQPDSIVLTDSVNTKEFFPQKKQKLVFIHNTLENRASSTYYFNNTKELTIDYFYTRDAHLADSVFLKHWNYKMEMVLRKFND